jgi:hypothetical protein
MKTEDKELLLRDLCARLPYGVMCITTDNDGSLPNIWKIVKADMINEDFFLIHDSYKASRTVDVKEVRPYLLPLLSMTKEQKKFFDDKNIELDGWEIVSKKGSHYQSSCYTDIEDWLEVIDWLNKNHFDYRGLINKGLAIDATNLGIYK